MTSVSDFCFFVIMVLLTSLKGTWQQQSQQQTAVCTNIIGHLDCSMEPASPLCSSLGVTYDTRCDFAQAHCRDSSVHLVHSGPCLPTDKPAPDPACSQLLNHTCPTCHGDTHVCGSDGQTYRNFCKFEKARCRLPSLQLLSLGNCPTMAAPTTISVFQLICKAIENEACPADVKPVCGSDSHTYNNACELEKAACHNDGLHMVAEHAC